MTGSDFRTWLNDYCAASPKTSAWLKTFPENPDGITPSRGKIIASWFQVLKDCELQDAQEATRLCASGDETIKFDSDTAKDIKAICGRLSGSRRFEKYRESWSTVSEDRQPRYRCPKCQDSGHVTVAHPDVVRFVRKFYIDGCEPVPEKNAWRKHDQYPPRVGNGRVCVRCYCELGKIKKDQKQAVLDLTLMVPVDYPPNDVDEIMEFYRSRAKPVCYSAAEFGSQPVEDF